MPNNFELAMVVAMFGKPGFEEACRSFRMVWSGCLLSGPISVPARSPSRRNLETPVDKDEGLKAETAGTTSE